jgi:hypothetical protein
VSHLVVGILLQQPLPDIPDFDTYLDHLGVEHESAAKCDLISGGSLWLTDGALCPATVAPGCCAKCLLASHRLPVLGLRVD